ncbi:hypothetical protein LTS18_009262 [Coniosporium uncinatum]|uniref:Uncharacterized protein n=1 Tax=Coniosporium uncinatum TaxID=93489 RepID=A0ACC3DCZ5_9PEZI|nr:hypothetical protein LTS18_009262 [Coniosporium uncinatum]
MDELQAKHRKEAKDLQSRITQKKKQATKKTRKGVNDECEQLERELKERQAKELAALDGDGNSGEEGSEEDAQAAVRQSEHDAQPSDGAVPSLEGPSMSDDTTEGIPKGGLYREPHQSRKPNRAKARLARRAAEQEATIKEAKEEVKNIPSQRDIERKKMLAAFKERGLQEKEIRADGHCLYSAVSDQMAQLNLDMKPKIETKVVEDGERENEVPTYRKVRRAAADWIQQHPDDFAPFLEEPLEEYVRKVRETGEWGGQLELLALAKTFGLDINVLQAQGGVEKIEGGGDAEKALWLAYYRHGFGLGEHYNSLRKAP